MARLVIRNLVKKFGNLTAIDDVSLDVEDGEFIVVLGPSGAGKTTLLKLIAGVELLTSGRVYIGDRLMNAVEPHKRNVAMAFESYALYPHYTVRRNLEFPLQAPGRNMSPSEVRQRVESVAQLLNIHMLLDRLPRMLSNGQKQRVALGRAMVREPDVLLLDEPISHLDAQLRHRMRAEFKALEAAIRFTTLYVTHDYLEALSLGDRLVVLDKGKIQQIGKPDKLLTNPFNIFVAKILGHPQINLVECNVQTSDEKMRLVSKDGAITIDVPDHLHALVNRANVNTLVAGIRPLHIQAVNGAAPANNVCTGKVYVYERLGTKGVLTASVGQQQMDILTPIEHRYEIDDTVKLQIDAEQMSLFDPKTEKNILFS